MPGMMKPPMGGMGSDQISQNMSMLNPTDLTMMAQEKKFTKDMTVADVLAQVGISPDDPAQKLLDLGKKQAQNANPLNKAKNMANQSGEMPPEGQGEAPGLDSLLNG